MSSRVRVPNVLTIAGVDPSGGAGVLADVKAFSALGAYGCGAIAALTAQNTRAVTGIHEVPPEFLKLQLDTLFDDVRIDAVKIGMLASRALIGVVADALRRYAPPFVVLDPVMVAKSGDRLLRAEGRRRPEARSLPLATVLTPNLRRPATCSGTPSPTHPRRCGMRRVRCTRSVRSTCSSRRTRVGRHARRRSVRRQSRRRAARPAHSHPQHPRHRLHAVVGDRGAPAAAPDGRGGGARRARLRARGDPPRGRASGRQWPRAAAPFPPSLGERECAPGPSPGGNRMNARQKFLATEARVDAAAIQPLPSSRKVYVEGARPISGCRCARSRKPTRRLVRGGAEPADLRLRRVRPVHGSRGANRYSRRPRAAACAVDRGTRRYGVLDGRARVRPRAPRGPGAREMRFDLKRRPRRANAGLPSRRCTTRAAASSTPEMEFVAIRENLRRREYVESLRASGPTGLKLAEMLARQHRGESVRRVPPGRGTRSSCAMRWRAAARSSGEHQPSGVRADDHRPQLPVKINANIGNSAVTSSIGEEVER